MGKGSSEDEDEGSAREERDLLEVLELTEELIRLKLALGGKMREGQIDIAAARYSRPHGGIGPTQYDMNMEAQTKLTATTCSRVAEDDLRQGGGEEDSKGGEGGRAQLELGLGQMTALQVNGSSGSVSGNGGGEGDGRAAEGNEGRETGGAAVIPRARPRKPVNWFGGMVNPQLRRAEKSFTCAVELVAQIATVSSKLLALTTAGTTAELGQHSANAKSAKRVATLSDSASRSDCT
eukprot:CAMPEP_0181392318 /NCGR_PEP_ID=MMETSP1106-20121128/26518_1 /TAXON_ID=81844 /ORGANISM="Mantoniella antarctica, Strain SL-175" /LENGTH=235 /DNA_ID=CAMNT_0023513415 /DNA_START=236 /DNA_END=942 /DNA_ORIENTATION=-